MITVVGNLKGGSGKSTLAFNISVWLAAGDRRVEVFDLDPQRTLSDVAEVRVEMTEGPLLSVSRDVDALRKLTKRRKAERPDEVVVDIGTADMAALHGALAVADRVLVPVPPSQADVWSTQRFLSMVQQEGKQGVEVAVFVNRADTHRAVRESDEAEEALGMLAGVNLLPQRLHQRTAYRRSFSEGLGVFELEPRGKAAQEFVELARILYS